MKCSAISPAAICWLVAALERNVETKRQKTHTPIQNDTHTNTDSNTDSMKPTIQHRSSITAAAVNQNRDVGANASKAGCPIPHFDPEQRPDVAPGPGPKRLDAETWRSRLTNDSLRGNFSRRNPSRLDLLYKLTPFRVGRDATLAGEEPVGELAFPGHLGCTFRLSRENHNYYWRKPTSTKTNQPTNQTTSNLKPDKR